MQKDKDAEISGLLLWNKRVLSIIGIWPKGNNDIRFVIGFIYLCIHVGSEWIDFVESIGNFKLILDNLSETIVFTVALMKSIVFRKNPILCQMIDAMIEDCENHKYKNSREKEIYTIYNSMAKKFYKTVLPLVTATAVLYYLKPIPGYLFANNQNQTTPYVLPFRTKFFFEIKDVYSYVLAYAYAGLSLHMVVIGWVAADGLLITLTLHVCGEMSVLAENIRDLKIDTNNKIQNIIKRHLKLIWMAKNIDTTFTIILLAQLMGCALLISLNGYNVIVNSEKTQRTSLLTFTFYEASMLLILYAYCFIGECLIQENDRIRDAFYQCDWHEMQISKSKDFIICMARCQKPLYLTAGKFYILSLENFTQIIKRSLTYLSVLRTLV